MVGLHQDAHKKKKKKQTKEPRQEKKHNLMGGAMHCGHQSRTFMEEKQG